MPPNAYSLIKEYLDIFGTPDFIVDACVPKSIVNILRAKGHNILSISEIDAQTKEPLSDNEISNISKCLGGSTIISLNVKHFEFLYGGVIPLKAGDTKYLIRQISRYSS